MSSLLIRVSIMALQALVVCVSKSRGFMGTLPSKIQVSSRVCRHGISHRLAFQSGLNIYGSFSPKKFTRCLSVTSSTKGKKGDSDSREKENLLAKAFDELARKDGFDSTLSHIADDATFEDDFFEDTFDDVEFNEDFDDTILDQKNFDASDFNDKTSSSFEDSMAYHDDDDDDDDDFLDFGGGGNDMDERIAQAKRDMVKGKVSVPKNLDYFAREATDDELGKLGFKKETDFHKDDETGDEKKAKLITNAMTCSACGSDFQSRDEQMPGYLPMAKFDTQVKLSKIEEMQQLKERADAFEWSPEDEIEFLIQTSGKGELDSNNERSDDDDININALVEELGLDMDALSKRKTICKRCHGLQNSGRIEESLRPGWTDEPTLSQEQFQELLRPISEKPAVIVALIDMFDFGGSVLRELDGIAGENPVILAANKADLMPSQMGKNRIENWVRRELEYMNVRSISNGGGSVRLVSCKTGDGVTTMMEKAKELAEEVGGDIYVVGAANAGKSTLINYILSRNGTEGKSTTKPKKRRAGNRNQIKGALTTSPLPGTTLKFIKIDLGDGQYIYDTPGLLVPGTITQLLTPDELKIVCPKKQVEPITFRVAAGKCVLVGGLAKVEVIGDSKPFLFTFFVANDIKLHPTDSNRAQSFVEKHTGTLLTPPLAPGRERMEQIGEFDYHTIEIDGAGWKEAAADITLTGLGWVAVTGSGRVKLRIGVPKGIGVSVRPPLMPYDIWEVAAKYTGAKAIRKPSKAKGGKRRKGVGRK
mmetsp:Transcript_6484/g.16017  ORF Transcript_6484/g.16017 Transcript_6484/m.16017 type:complete len:762 (+) Transcript_6484:241-2526(+)